MTWVFACFSVALALPLTGSFFGLLPRWLGHPAAPLFLLGAGLGAVLAWVLSRRAPMLLVLEHEMTHLLMALCLLRQPVAMKVGREDGEVVYTGRGSTLIRLAPYMVPTGTLLLLAVSPLIGDRHRLLYVGLLGLTWGYHLWTSWQEARPHQPDLRRGGLLASYLTVVGLGLVLHLGAATLAVGRGALLHRWVSGAVDRVFHLL